MDDDFVKKRLERDLADLKRMCDDHFKKRAEDDSHITDLEGRISKRQEVWSLCNCRVDYSDQFNLVAGAFLRLTSYM